MSKRVLICPLDWGLGHATRCIPVIHELEKMGSEVLIAGSGDSLALLRIEFPGKKFFNLTPYAIRYSNTIPFVLNLALQLPRFLSVMTKEHREVEEIVKKENIDFVISDNRYGCYHDKIPTAIIIHQLSLPLSLATRYNEKFVKRFSQCWVPDTTNHDLSGKLSINKNIPNKFIGPLSRMRSNDSGQSFDVLGLISGPEPHRTDFDNALTLLLKKSNLSYKIVRGLPSIGSSDGNVFSHLPSSQLAGLVESAGVVIARSGYSTIMDLAALKKKAIFVPTPGQAEQLYLAEEMQRKKIAPMVSQSNLVLPMDELMNYTGFRENYFDNELLQNTLREFLESR